MIIFWIVTFPKFAQHVPLTENWLLNSQDRPRTAFGRITLWVQQSISPICPVYRWQVAPYAPFCRGRCHRLNGPSDRGTQVVCPHTLQPASPLHLWWACAPHAPQLPVQQCTPGLPPPPPVHEQEDGECKVKVTNLQHPVSVSCCLLMQVNIQIYSISCV